MPDENPQTEAAKKQYAMDKEASDKSKEQFLERMKGKPTPTQEENDMAVLGAPVFEKEDDGSGPDPNVKSVEADKPGSYQTRHSTASHASPQQRTPQRPTPSSRSE